MMNHIAYNQGQDDADKLHQLFLPLSLADSYKVCKGTGCWQKQLEVHWDFQQGNCPHQLHAETAGAVH